MPSILIDPVQHLLSKLESSLPRCIIGMAGVPGSGKSTLAASLAEQVNSFAGPGAMITLGMDGFHLTKAELRQIPNPDEAFARRGAPWTFDANALANRLQSLRSAAGREPVPWPDFQHDRGDPVEAAFTVLPATRLVLVEGNYLLHRSDGWEMVSQEFDERWYLDTPLDVAMERLAKRHMAAWGITRAAAASRIASNDRLNAEVILEDRPFANWLLAT